VRQLYERIVAKRVRQLFLADIVRQTGNFGTATWDGVTIWQNLYDLWTATETIQAVRPSLIVETGTYLGGSALYYGNLLDQIGGGRVITIDVENRHQRQHPRIDFLIGDSTSPGLVAFVREAAAGCGGPVLVILDSDHHAEHVLREMKAYGPMVTSGSFMLVQDGVIDVLPSMKTGYRGPLHAIRQFLPEHPEFEVDQSRCDRFLITHHPCGWLRRLPQGGPRVGRGGLIGSRGTDRAVGAGS
jgi:cephalosporin hydroxylase